MTLVCNKTFTKKSLLSKFIHLSPCIIIIKVRYPGLIKLGSDSTNFNGLVLEFPPKQT